MRRLPVVDELRLKVVMGAAILLCLPALVTVGCTRTVIQERVLVTATPRAIFPEDAAFVNDQVGSLLYSTYLGSVLTAIHLLQGDLEGLIDDPSNTIFKNRATVHSTDLDVAFCGSTAKERFAPEDLSRFCPAILEATALAMDLFEPQYTEALERLNDARFGVRSAQDLLFNSDEWEGCPLSP